MVELDELRKRLRAQELTPVRDFRDLGVSFEAMTPPLSLNGAHLVVRLHVSSDGAPDISAGWKLNSFASVIEKEWTRQTCDLSAVTQAGSPESVDHLLSNYSKISLSEKRAHVSLLLWDLGAPFDPTHDYAIVENDLGIRSMPVERIRQETQKPLWQVPSFYLRKFIGGSGKSKIGYAEIIKVLTDVAEQYKKLKAEIVYEQTLGELASKYGSGTTNAPPAKEHKAPGATIWDDAPMTPGAKAKLLKARVKDDFFGNAPINSDALRRIGAVRDLVEASKLAIEHIDSGARDDDG